MNIKPTEAQVQVLIDTVDHSIQHVRAGGIPFTAAVVDRHGHVLGRGVNRVRADQDPTAHAEVDAIRNACKAHGISFLRGATLLASGEPCAMCYVNVLSAGIKSIIFAVSREEVAGFGFDYRSGYTIFSEDPTAWTYMQCEHVSVANGLSPFKLYQGLDQ